LTLFPECAREQQSQNIVILRDLLADEDTPVRMAAAVSLLLLDQDVVRRPIIEWLSSSDRWQKQGILRALVRAASGGKLEFVRPRIEAIAKDESLDRYTRKPAREILRKLGDG